MNLNELAILNWRELGNAMKKRVKVIKIYNVCSWSRERNSEGATIDVGDVIVTENVGACEIVISFVSM